jgi:pilus assembly protein Flp/PilA
MIKNLEKQIKKSKGELKMMKNFKRQIMKMMREEKGQGMVEYALLVGLIAVVVIAVLVLMGPAISTKFQDIITALT